MNKTLYTAMAIIALSTPLAAFEYDPANSGFRALDNELTERENAELLAKRKRIEAKKLSQQRLNDCVDDLLSARYSAPDSASLDLDKTIMEVVRECGSWGNEKSDAELWNDYEFDQAFLHAYEFKPQKFTATKAVEDAWKANHAPVAMTASPKDAAPKEAKPAEHGIFIYMAVFWAWYLLIGIDPKLPNWKRKPNIQPDDDGVIDLDKSQWSRARIEPIFDVKPERKWENI